jgi:hypothetical protein
VASSSVAMNYQITIKWKSIRAKDDTVIAKVFLKYTTILAFHSIDLTDFS